MARLRRSLGLIPGNPMNPVTLIVFGVFGLTLLGFPPIMWAMGLGGGGILLVMTIAVLTAALCCGLTVAFARRYLRDFERLVGGEHWAHWRTTPAERARFVVQERRRAGRPRPRAGAAGPGWRIRPR